METIHLSSNLNFSQTSLAHQWSYKYFCKYHILGNNSDWLRLGSMIPRVYSTQN